MNVAQSLLGKYLVHVTEVGELVAKIVEVEAYLGAHDQACHSARGLTKRTEVMFGPPGMAYVYLIYGIHHCMNIVTESEGNAAAVLIRAVEPVKNIMVKTAGPGLVCKAMHITRQQNGIDLTGDQLYIAFSQQQENFKIVKRPRIGIDYAGHYWARRLLRFYIKDNKHISND